MEADLIIQADQFGKKLMAAHQAIVTAESCTGGWIAQTITEIAGSSGWFDRGFVPYSNAAKIEMLGIDPQILSLFGAVSAETACAMASGALEHSNANLAIAVTGIAGPDGGSQEKPVGLVFFAWQWKGHAPTVLKKQFIGNRHEIRLQTVATALVLPYG